MKPIGFLLRNPAILMTGLVLCLGTPAAFAATVHVWEKVEITLPAEKVAANPCIGTRVWVDLKGPDFAKRCYGFWDGSNMFRVRVLATAPDEWQWRSGSEPEDRGLSGVSGSFVATAWTDAEKAMNPNRRGMIRPSPNGHAFQYGDGMPFFLVGDTWWATPTFRFRWFDDDTPRPLGPEAGFTAKQDLFLCYFEKDCAPATLSGALPGGEYGVSCFNPRTGDWLDAASSRLVADASGRIVLPGFPGSQTNSDLIGS